MNIVEIFKSWAIAYDPSEEQSQLAAKRIEICNSCDAKKTEPVIYCGDCGCPLSKKVFTPYMNRCPRGKWDEVDRVYFEKNNEG
jgi:hypothetical protein